MLKETIGSSEEGGGEEFQISGKNPKLGQTRIPSVDELTKQTDRWIGRVSEFAPRIPYKNEKIGSLMPPTLARWHWPPIGSMKNENEFDFESRRSIFNKIMEAIKDDGVGIIGIWGMPGIGKTTLVKRVAKYALDEGLFEKAAMVVVSQNPSVKTIQGEIAEKIGLKLTSESEGGKADQLLQRLLATKKILIILDDIWDSIELNDIGIPSESHHKIILTSRKRGVCEQMGTGKIFKIDLLSSKEALDLFLQMSGNNNRFSIKQLAEKLSEKCGRLPISIATVARRLLNKDQPYWNDMLNPLRNSDPNGKVHATIELSYYDLNCKEEKMFFLLCAMFPEDYEIPVQVLLEYGLGLDLFERVDNVDEAVVRAYKLASSLKSSSLLLDEGDENSVKMHDVIRDVALAIASEEKHAFLVPGKTATSFMYDDVKKLPDVLECPQLQILMVQCSYPDFQLHDNFFARMKNLIVLDMSRMRSVQLPQSFAALESLRTLRFSDCSLRDISAIGKLQNLVCLSFYGSYIEVLPTEVGELSNLRLLDLSSCKSLEIITPGVIQNLSQLEVLRVGSNVRWCDGKEVCHPENASLSELIHLSCLMILEICVPYASMLPDDVLFENLMKFNVSIGEGDFVRMNIFSSNPQILKLASLSENEFLKVGIKMLMKKAQVLVLEDISGMSVALPSHLGGFGLLKELIVNHCLDVNYVLKVSESEYEPEAPCLQQLHLIDLPLLKEISKGEFHSLSFSKLEHLKLRKLPSLVHLWQFDAKYMALANLTSMSVESCHKLEYVFEYSSTKSLSKLKELEVGKCRNLHAICPSKQQDDEIVFPQLSLLKLSELENLTSFVTKFTSESTLLGKQVIFRALETLDINSLDKLKRLWHIHTPVESFFKLKILKLTRCPSLLVVFPPQATSGLKNLEEICIENCHKLETLFQVNDVPLTEMVLLPQLLALKLVNLPKLTTLSRTTSQNISQVIFCALETLDINSLEKLEKIWHIHTPFVSFLQLKVLKLTRCPGLLVVFPPQATLGLKNLEEICIENCHKLEKLFQLDDAHLSVGAEMVLFPRLLTLKLVNLPKVTIFSSSTSQNISQATVVFSDMDIMTSYERYYLKFSMDQQLSTFFPKLKKLDLEGIGCLSSTADTLHIIKGLEALEELRIIDNNGKTLVQGLVILPNISKLQFGFIREPIESCERLNRWFRNLRSLNFFSCNDVQILLTPSVVSCLVQLKELFVSNCETMESILGEMSGEQNFDKAIEFSKLRTLKLLNLSCLASFYNGECALKFPCLGDFSIEECPKLKKIVSMSRETPEQTLFGQEVSFGRLSHLKLWRLESVEEIWHCDHLATTVRELIHLSVEGCDGLLKLFPSNLLSGLHLKELRIRSCRSLEHVFAVEDHPLLLSNLVELELYDLPELKQLWWNKNTRESFGLPSLDSLTINTCPTLQFIFDPSVDNRLQNLRTLVVKNCSSIIEIVAEKPGKKIEFRLLYTLILDNLPCFKVNQSVEFPHAGFVFVDRCFNMKKSCLVNGKRELAGQVRFFESFVE